MRIHLCLVSSDQGAKDLVERERSGLIPKSLRDHPRMRSVGASFSTSVYDPTVATKPLAQYLLARENDEVIVLLLDTSLGDFAKDVECACFTTSVEFATHPKSNYRNYLAGKLSRLLKNLRSLVDIMADSANEQVMLLPFRNFKAQQLRDLRDVCRNEALSPGFANMVTQLVDALKNRRRPRRNSTDRRPHYVDDDGKLFQYGFERHARPATGAPHGPVCALTGNFRFGKRIANTRHYNVTKESGRGTQIGGAFPNCHDAVCLFDPRTHLNMFSNDYME